MPFSTRGEHGGDGQVRISAHLIRKFGSAHAVVGLRPRAMARKMRLNERNWCAPSDPVPALRTKFNKLRSVNRAVHELSSSQEPLGAAPAWPPMPPPLKTPPAGRTAGYGVLAHARVSLGSVGWGHDTAISL